MSSVLEHVHSRRNLNKYRVENLKTCVQGIFCRVRTCEKPCELVLCLAAACACRLKTNQVTEK